VPHYAVTYDYKAWIKTTNDREQYTNAKTKFIDNVLEKERRLWIL